MCDNSLLLHVSVFFIVALGQLPEYFLPVSFLQKEAHVALSIFLTLSFNGYVMPHHLFTL